MKQKQKAEKKIIEIIQLADYLWEMDKRNTRINNNRLSTFNLNTWSLHKTVVEETQ